MAWSHVKYLCIIVMFLSAAWSLIWHPFTAVNPLLTVMECTFFSNMFPWRNKLIYIFICPEGEYIFQQIFIFGWTIPLLTHTFSSDKSEILKEQNRTVWMCSSRKRNADGVFENFRLSLATFNYMSVCFCKALDLGDPHPWESTYALGLIDIGISMRNVKLD